MGDLPDISSEQLKGILPSAESIEEVGKGGQKRVFRIQLEGNDWALKVAKVPQEAENEEEPFDVVSTRANREIETMRDCASPYMVKLGPVGLTFANVDSEHILYFSEEFIPGRNLKEVLEQDGPLKAGELIKLGIQVTDAIKELWALGKIHRDIKPGNIMHRGTSGDYVLLDAGLVFDIVGDSLSRGFLVGTRLFFSPEQLDYSSRRTVLDFRSDIFALGVTLYLLATGKHPFTEGADSQGSFFTKIRTFVPTAPSTHNKDIPECLDAVILQMLGKSPHLRYRKCDQLIAALEGCGE